MNIMFFDTETTGLPRNWNAPASDVNNWPRTIQLAWQIADSLTEDVSKSYKELIKPDGWVVPEGKFWVDNGYSTQKCIELGHPIADAISNMFSAVEEYDITMLVAHNMAYDSKILGAEMIRMDMKAERRLTQVCTMKASTDLCQIPGKFGWKYPSLTELHTWCFGEGFEGAHDALADVSACRRSFFHLVKIGQIVLPQIPQHG